MGEVPTEFNSFFNFARIFYWYEIKAYFLKNLFLTNFFFHLWSDINWYVLVYFVIIRFTNENIEENESYKL